MSDQSSKSKTIHTGEIRISPAAIARVAHDAALQSYGVVGMSDPWLDAVRRAITHRDAPGVRVRVRKDRIVVDLYVVVQYGEINVHVQDVRVNHEQSGGSNA